MLNERVFNIGENFEFLEEIVHDQTDKPRRFHTKVYKLKDKDTQDIYFFKHGLTSDTHILHELMCLEFSKQAGAEVCDFKYAYSSKLKKFGLLTKLMSKDMITLHSYVQENIANKYIVDSMEYKEAIVDLLDIIPTEEHIKFFKISACDLITLNRDRHEANIGFMDKSMKMFYPMFDCDAAFARRPRNLRDISFRNILKDTFEDLQLINIFTSLVTIGENNGGEVDPQVLKLNEDFDTSFIKDIQKELFNRDEDYVEYFQRMVKNFNAFVETFRGIDIEDLMDSIFETYMG